MIRNYEDVYYYDIISSPKLFQLVKSPPITYQYTGSIQEIPTYETFIRHYIEIWINKRINQGKNIPAKKTIRSLENELGDLSIRQVFEQPDKILLAVKSIELRDGIYRAMDVFKLLKALGLHMMDACLIPKNIFKDAYEPIVSPLPTFQLSDSQRTEIYGLCKDPSLLPVGFILSIGISKEEFMTLKRKNYKSESQTLVIPKIPGSKRYSREIPLPLIAKEWIEGKKDLQDNDPLFGKSYTEYSLQKAMQKMKDKTGIQELSWSHITKDFIIRCLRAGVDPIQLKEWLGLSRPNTLLDYWMKVPL